MSKKVDKGGRVTRRQFIQTAMLALGAYIVIDQQVSSGVMIAATILLGRALAPVEQLVGGWRALGPGPSSSRPAPALRLTYPCRCSRDRVRS